MSHFLIMWAPWIVIILAIASVFAWGTYGKTE
ncbi:cytochrome bd oxidase small subunit CydS [Pseudalkalibacillus caeni]